MTAEQVAGWLSVFDPATHAKWARMCGRTVSNRFGFGRGSHEEDELVAVARLAVVVAAGRFDPARVPPGGDPVRAFRGWACRNVTTECTREARRLRNGGTYRTRREPGESLVVLPLSDLGPPPARAADPEDDRAGGFDLIDPRGPAEYDEMADPQPRKKARPAPPPTPGLDDADRAREAAAGLAATVRAVAAGPLRAHLARLGGADFAAQVRRVEEVLAELAAFAAAGPVEE